VKLGPALAHAAAIAAMVALAPAAALADEDADMSVSDCGAPRRLDGIDVSKWQGEIDWRRVHKAGIVFAFVRLADGLDADERFRENWKATRHAHVRRGAYQYFRASEDGKQQADFALKMLRHAGHADLPLVADVETDDGQPREVVQAELQKWLARVEKRLHVRPLVYLSPKLGGAMLDGRFGRWPLWVAHYEVDCPTLPDGWERWTFWQHAKTGRVDGINGDVDLDHFAGTKKELRRLGRHRHRHASSDETRDSR